MNISIINKIIGEYTAGNNSAEATNRLLEAAGSDLRIVPGKNEIGPGETDRFGLLDTGTGTLDKVEVQGDTILNADAGDMKALLIFKGQTFKVAGNKLIY